MEEIRQLIESTKQSSEYQKGLEVLGNPDDYASQIMLEFINFFYYMAKRHNGNLEELKTYLQQMGFSLNQNGSEEYFIAQDEEALITAFTYFVGRTSLEYFQEFLKLRAELANSES